VAAALALAGCTDSGTDQAAEGAKGPDVSTAPSPAASGKYQNLPNPCGAVPADQLRRLLGSGAKTPGGKTQTALDGRPRLTYDAHRRVGCDWKVKGTDGARTLSVDFERVVSYSASASDDERAQDVFAAKAEEHGLAPGATQQDGPGKSRPAATPDASANGTTAPADDGDDPEHVAPRRLDDPGDEAFLDDQATTSGKESRRTVTVVFRTSNVVVTLTYGRSLAADEKPPNAADLQDNAQQLAGKLADQLTG
jgi:hypothetical protein